MDKVFSKVSFPKKIVRRMVMEGYYKANEEQKIKKMQEAAIELSEFYNAPGIEKIQVNKDLSVYGRYDRMLRNIELRNCSIVTFLHEFRHHLQNHAAIKVSKKGVEYDAQGWACSVFSQACPNLYKKAVKENKIMILE